MSRIIKTRRAKVLLGAVAALAITAVALAYLSSTGSGSGTGFWPRKLTVVLAGAAVFTAIFFAHSSSAL